MPCSCPQHCKLLTTKQSLPKNQPDLGKKELLVKPETRVWKGDQQVKLAECDGFEAQDERYEIDRHFYAF